MSGKNSIFQFRYGGKKGKQHSLAVSEDLVVVRTHSRRGLNAASFSKKSRSLLDELHPVAAFPDAGIEIRRYGIKRRDKASRGEAQGILRNESDCRFAGRVLCDRRCKDPILYTENFFVKLEDDARASDCKKMLKGFGLTIKRELEYARNAYFVAAREGTGRKVFELAQDLLEEAMVELCHPELIRQVRHREAFPQQWHLIRTTIGGKQIDAHIDVASAWKLTQGEGTVISIIDDGIDIDHEEFASPGKIIAPLNASSGTSNPRPGSGNNHGTACAGVAAASGLHGASGVAPKARLLPIRLTSGLGSQAEADAFIWAAKNGADVISCSWGPQDGRWWEPNDPLHNQVVPLPDSTRLAIDWAIKNGRDGKGCVITWAAGNGNESVDNDGYASYEKVIAVAACNDSDKKSSYSDFGRAILCAFPSNDGVPSKTPGIWTTDRSGPPGYNPGQTNKGDANGNYTNDFGGTSSSCPGVAGVAALVISRNPSLRWDQVKDILKRSCEQIDPAGANYDTGGHSPIYGYGRLKAGTAVALALPAQPSYTAIHTAAQDVPIQDLKTSTIQVEVGDSKIPKAFKVVVDIEHTYIGDLVVLLMPPPNSGIAPVTLHNRAGGGTKNIKKTFDLINTPGLANVTGKNPQGTWALEVQDKEKQDTGKILKFTVELNF